MALCIRKNLIPDKDSLVQSRIKPQYLSKKRSWSFSIIFVVVGEDIEEEVRQLSKLGIKKLNTRPSINFLNEKLLALQVFNTAKSRLNRKLHLFPDFEIKYVSEVEIKGYEVKNSDLLE